jgi:lysophospholipase L1-like esterase
LIAAAGVAILLVSAAACALPGGRRPAELQTGTTQSAPPRVPVGLQGVRKIVALGDSITEGGEGPGGYVRLMRDTLKKLYPNQKIEVLNAGISGHKSTDMLARFQRDVLEKNPDMVTISVGVNDVWHGYRDFQRGVNHPKGDLPNGVPLPVYREKVSAMVDAAKARHIGVVLLSPTLIYEDLESVENRRLREYVAAMREVAREKGVGFIDLHRPFQEALRAYQKHAGRTGLLLTTDGVHMNPAGNRVMAYTILRGLGIPARDLPGL